MNTTRSLILAGSLSLLTHAALAAEPASPPASASAPAAAATASQDDVQKLIQAQEIRLTRLEGQLQNQGLLNLLNQVEALKAEVARLRGAQEELAFQQTAADKRAKDLLADFDDRLKEVENRPPAVAAAAPPPDAVRLQPAQVLASAAVPAPAANMETESNAYEAAHNLVKAGRYKEGVVAFQNFVKRFPSSALAPNAHYWIGFSYVGLSDFTNAAASYQLLIREFPRSAKTADAMLSLARAQVQMNVTAEAVTTLEQLLARFPYSRAAESGKKLLATLK